MKYIVKFFPQSLNALWKKLKNFHTVDEYATLCVCPRYGMRLIYVSKIDSSAYKNALLCKQFQRIRNEEPCTIAYTQQKIEIINKAYEFLTHTQNYISVEWNIIKYSTHGNISPNPYNGLGEKYLVCSRFDCGRERPTKYRMMEDIRYIW